MDTNDPRSIRTVAAIRDTFWSLLREVGFSKITVSQIVKRARINRSTFYDYYCDKYALLSELQNQFLDDLRTIANSAPGRGGYTLPGMDSIAEHCRRYTHYIYDNRDKYVLFFVESGNSQFAKEMLREMLQIGPRVKAFYPYLKDLGLPPEYANVAIQSMTQGIINTWVENGLKESPDDIAHIISHLVVRFFKGQKQEHP